ncbi:MAG: hypothetical protein RM338_30385 [Nostoc sp. DedQUE12a]|nr:hypothetical protein [Nostoc sp. DedQUE12a]
MKTKNLLIATGTALTLLMTNLPSFAQVVNHESINLDTYSLDANVNLSDKEDDEDKLNDFEIKLLIEIINETEEKELKDLAIKVLKKYYNELTDEQKKLIKDGIKDKEILKKITDEKLVEQIIDSKFDFKTQPNLIPETGIQTDSNTTVPLK